MNSLQRIVNDRTILSRGDAPLRNTRAIFTRAAIAGVPRTGIPKPDVFGKNCAEVYFSQK